MRWHRMAVAGEPFSYLAAGPEEGDLVLCLHGFPDVAATWAPVMEELSGRGFRVVAPAMRGYAPSTLRGPFDPVRLGEDVLGFVDVLSPGRPAAVVGHDWGAVATYVAAMLAPERLSRIATLAIPHPLAFRSVFTDPAQARRSWYIGFFQLPWAPEVALRRGDWALVERLWRRWSPGLEPPPTHLREVRRCFEASMPAPIDYYRALLRRAPRVAAAALRLSLRLAVPCLYLHGADDGCVSAEVARGHERWFEGELAAELVPAAGHFLHLERPREVAARIAEWLA